MIILTENLASLINITALLFGWQPFSMTNINGWNLGNPFIWHKDEYKDKKFINKYQNSGVSGAVGHVRVLAYNGLIDMLKATNFKKIRIYTRGYLPFYGKLSDFLCCLDKRHGHFLIATAFK